MAQVKSNEGTDIRLFYFGGGRSERWASKLILAMEVEKPVAVMEHAPTSTRLESAKSALSQASKRLGVKVAICTIDGALYAMRLQDQQAAA